MTEGNINLVTKIIQMYSVETILLKVSVQF